jgi:hypothetical protein
MARLTGVTSTSERGGNVDETKRMIEEHLSLLLAAKDRLVCAEIDAGACQTDSDWQRKNEALEAYQGCYELTVRALARMIDRDALSTTKRRRPG